MDELQIICTVREGGKYQITQVSGYRELSALISYIKQKQSMKIKSALGLYPTPVNVKGVNIHSILTRHGTIFDSALNDFRKHLNAKSKKRYITLANKLYRKIDYDRI